MAAARIPPFHELYDLVRNFHLLDDAVFFPDT